MNNSIEAIDLSSDADFDLAPYEGLDTEHILIEGEQSARDAKPTTVGDRQIIDNRLGGIVTELTLYGEGFLRIRQGTARRPLKNHLVETRFLDPVYDTTWHVAKGWLWTMWGTLAAGLVAWLLLPLFGLPALAPWMLLAAVGLAGVAGYQFLRRTGESHVFRTSLGRTDVLRLDANLGCLRKTRKAAKAISRAIAGARLKTASVDLRELRAEIQAHYRLMESGVISKDACSEGTAQILARFT